MQLLPRNSAHNDTQHRPTRKFAQLLKINLQHVMIPYFQKQGCEVGLLYFGGSGFFLRGQLISGTGTGIAFYLVESSK